MAYRTLPLRLLFIFLSSCLYMHACMYGKGDSISLRASDTDALHKLSPSCSNTNETRLFLAWVFGVFVTWQCCLSCVTLSDVSPSYLKKSISIPKALIMKYSDGGIPLPFPIPYSDHHSDYQHEYIKQFYRNTWNITWNMDILYVDGQMNFYT